MNIYKITYVMDSYIEVNYLVAASIDIAVNMNIPTGYSCISAEFIAEHSAFYDE